MTHMRAAALAAAFGAVAAPAAAQQLGFSGGLSITSNYMSRGLTQSADRPALQFWGEADIYGLYAGLWASTVRLAPDSVELNLHAGYRFSVGATEFDIGYTRFLYDSTGDCCGEVHARFEVDAQPGAWFGALAYDPSARQVTDTHLGVRYDFMDRFSTSATVGRAPGATYGILGLGYQLNESVGFEAAAHLTTAQRSRLVLSTRIGF
jgi:uncharacterized protein (TIGR02001 family)